IYSVVATDENGCAVSSQEIPITEPEILAITETHSNYNGYGVSCNGSNDGFIDITVTGGYGEYSFEWSNGAILEDISDLVAGTYSVTATDENLCSVSIEVEITEPEILEITIETVSEYNGYEVSCNGENDGFIDITVTGGTGIYTYAWADGADIEDISGLGAGTYSVNATDENGCVETLDIEITEPEILEITIETVSEYNGYEVSCNGSNDGFIDITVAGGTGIYTYAWTDGADTQDRSDLVVGIYSVVATDENGCAVSSQEIPITEPEILAITETHSNYNGNGYGVSCNGSNDGFIDITVTGGYGEYSFEWSNGAILEDISDLGAGTYSVTATDENLCSVSIEVEITEPSILEYSVDISECIEEYGVIKIYSVSGGAGEYQYKLNEGVFSNEYVFTNLTQGEYSITVLDQNGCSSTENYTLNAKPITDFSISENQFFISENLTFFTDQTIDSNIDTWLWDFGDGNTSNETNPSYLYKEAGIYYVTLTITDENGCKDQMVKKIEALYEYYSYTPNIFTPNGDGINDIFSPSILNINRDSYTLLIYDRWGNKVYSTTKYGQGWDGKIENGELLPPDTYNYKILYTTKTGEKKQELGRFTMAQ
ncbi:gliding motility-associated C-terminal domain-containing protein, partial [Flavobacteriales bacterium]|nr:gliding motility-associated C-terminal domain-containing protein [Flavobacteriales bacterium]